MSEYTAPVAAQEKPGWMDTPYPELLLMPVRKLWEAVIGGGTLKPLSDRVLRRVLLILTVVSLAVIWLLEGLVNPLELLVDIPFFSFVETVEEWKGYYLVFLPFFTLLAVGLLNTLVCRGREMPLFSANGLLFWVVCLALSIAVDSFMRNMFLPWFHGIYIQIMEMQEDTTMRKSFCFLLFLLVIAIATYYAIRDITSTSLSIFATPYLVNFLVRGEDLFPVLKSPLLCYLLVTLVLKLAINLLEKAGLLEAISGFFVRWLFTFRGLMRFYAIPLCVVCPIAILFVIYFRKRRKQK